MKWKYVGAIIGAMVLTIGCGFGAAVYFVNVFLGTESKGITMISVIWGFV